MEFKPMTKFEFEIFIERHLKQLFNDAMKTKIATETEVNRYLEMDMNNIIPDGFETPNHYWLKILNNNSEEVGAIWHSFRGKGERKTPYLGDIYIAPEFRRQGYAKNAFTQYEMELKSQGIKNNIAVHLVGDFNEAAISLCRSCGFNVSGIPMEKRMIPLF